MEMKLSLENKPYYNSNKNPGASPGGEKVYGETESFNS